MTAALVIDALEEKFLFEYAIDFDPERAALAVNPDRSPATARGWASRVLAKRVNVDRLQKIVKEQGLKHGVTRDRTMQELAAIAYANSADYYEQQTDGSRVVKVEGLSRYKWAAIREIKITEVTRGLGDNRKTTRKMVVKLYNKLTALDMLARVQGMYDGHEAPVYLDQRNINTTNVNVVAGDSAINAYRRMMDVDAEPQ